MRLLRTVIAWHARRFRPPRAIREARLREHIQRVRQGYYVDLDEADDRQRPL